MWSRAALMLTLLAAPVWGQDFVTLKGHGGPIMDIVVASDGTVVSASFDNAVGVWGPDGPAWLDGHAAAVTTVQITAGGDIRSGGDDFAVRAWTSGQGKELYRHKAKVTALASSESHLASASWDATIGLWSPQGGPRFMTGHKSGVNDVVFSPGGSKLFSAGVDGTIRVWDAAQARETQLLLSHGFGVNTLALDPAGNWLAYGAVDGGTRIVDPTTGTKIADLTLDRRPILSMAHHAGTHQLAVGDGHGYIMMVNTQNWSITHDFRATQRGPVWALAFSPDGSMIYAGGLDDVVYGWPVALMDQFDPAISGERSFLRDAGSMPNGERQFMRKCSICHALTDQASRKAGPSLANLFGRRAGTWPGYRYSPILDGSDIIWDEDSIDALFDLGPDHYIPGSKMPMQRIVAASDRADLIAYLKQATAAAAGATGEQEK